MSQSVTGVYRYLYGLLVTTGTSAGREIDMPSVGVGFGDCL